MDYSEYVPESPKRERPRSNEKEEPGGLLSWRLRGRNLSYCGQETLLETAAAWGLGLVSVLLTSAGLHLAVT